MADTADQSPEELREEDALRLVGFNLMSEALATIDAPTIAEPEKNKALAWKLLLDRSYAYFKEHPDQELNPETKKQILAGFSIAYTFWLNRNHDGMWEEVNE